MDVVMNEEKRKYPYGKVSDQNRRMERKASAETNPEKQDAEYEKANRHFGIHKRVGNLPYHKLGNKENRLQPNEKIPKTKETNRFANRLTRSDGQGIRDSYEYDLYDIILSHLLDEGYADTQEQAEAIMVNMSEDWRESIVEEVLDEAEGSYGQTPKAQQKMGDLANKRRNTPASEYSERGEKKKKVDSASRHFNRMGNPDAGNKGKKSSRPYYPAGRKGMTQKDRDWSRGADEYGHSGYDGEGGGGSLPKGKKLERQRKSGVSD